MPIYVKRKPQKRSHVLFKLPAREQEWLKNVPRNSFNAFKNKTHDITDWNNITFRIKVGVELARNLYANETLTEMNEVLQVCLKLAEAYKETQQLILTQEDLDSIEMGLDAVDTMQNETLRKDQLLAYRITDAFMKKLIN